MDLVSLEQRPLERSRPRSVPWTNTSWRNASMTRSPSIHSCWGDTPDATGLDYVLPPPEDRGMFSSQCASRSGEKASANYATKSGPKAYYDMPYTRDMSSRPSYIQSDPQICDAGITIPPIKEEEDYLSPFSRSYASIHDINLRRTSQLLL